MTQPTQGSDPADTRSTGHVRSSIDAVRATVFGASIDAMVVVDEHDRYVDANPAACTLLGRTREEILCCRVGDFAAQGHDGAAVFRRFVATPSGRGDHRIRRPDGTVRDVEFELRANFVPGLHLGVFRDVTEQRAAEHALRGSEARFRAVFDGIPAPVLVLRWDGALLRVVEANRRIQDSVGVRLPQGTPMAAFLAHRPDLLAMLERCARERTSVREEVDWRSLADGRRLRFRGLAHFVPPDLVVAFAEDVTDQRAAEAERDGLLGAERETRSAAERAEHRHRSLAVRVTDMLETVQRNIARELHDEIGQELTALGVLLQVAARGPAAAHAAALADAERRVAETLARVRTLSTSLRPPMLDDLGLVAAVASNAARFSEASGVRVDFAQVGADRRFSPAVEVAAYRIVQEALTNVSRHSGRKEAQVRLWAREGTLYVEVRDAGSGFDAEASGEGCTSGGLAGMRERAELVGGTLTLESTPGRGTVVTAALPVESRDG